MRHRRLRRAPPGDEFLLEGLRRLEYRGYDSAGIATLTPDRRFHVAKAVGRIDALAERVADLPAAGHDGHRPHPLGHARRAERGQRPSALRRRGRASRVSTLAHNGVIENYLALKEKLLGEGYAFASSTDTEVIAHLIARSLAKMEARRDEFPAG